MVKRKKKHKTGSIKVFRFLAGTTTSQTEFTRPIVSNILYNKIPDINRGYKTERKRDHWIKMSALNYLLFIYTIEQVVGRTPSI